ncbi:MAG: hypothetical protein GY765_30420 [bacterium]|nr:hypothetical protein [bacterium]
MDKNCPRSREILEGLEKGLLTFDMERHMEECPVCADVALVGQWMGKFEAVSLKYDAEKILPDPEALWEKAHAAPTRIDKALIRKAMLPLLIPKYLSIAAAFLLVFVLAFGNMEVVKDFMMSNVETGFFTDFFFSTLPGFCKSFSFLKIPFIMSMSLVAAYVLYSIFDPEKV